MSIEDHLATILATVSTTEPVRIPLAEALGLTLAADVNALVRVPGFDNSAMDGYAVIDTDVATASAESPVTLLVVADLAAGTDEDPLLVPGQAARIMTGAPMPAGATAIVPVEDTDGGVETVTITRPAAAGAHLRLAGGDVEPGGLVLTAGDEVTARHIAAAASTGHADLMVYPAPRVGVLSTGSELVKAGEPLKHGQIHDSNSLMLAALVTAAGATAVHLGSVSDDEAEFERILADNAHRVDAFLLSGGVSVGAYDVVKAVLSRMGSVRFVRVPMQPGKPQGFGVWADGTPIFGLPGNPVSAFVSFEVFVRPALRTMMGCREPQRALVPAVAAVGWRTPPGRRQYIPVTIHAEKGVSPAVRPSAAGGSGSHLVASLAAADALAVVEADVDEVRAGDTVTVMLVRP